MSLLDEFYKEFWTPLIAPHLRIGGSWDLIQLINDNEGNMFDAWVAMKFGWDK